MTGRPSWHAPAVSPHAIPEDAGALEPQTLTDLLSERHPGVRVAHVEVARRQQVTNSHAWLSVTYDEPAGAPTSLFCKLLPGDDRRAQIAATGMGLREAWFYDRLASSLPWSLLTLSVTVYVPGTV